MSARWTVPADPFLTPAPGPVASAWGLPEVDPAWGLPAVERLRVLREQATPVACVVCGGTGFVVTHEDGDVGYRPCHRCPPAVTDGAA